jgi:hypothetical protein
VSRTRKLLAAIRAGDGAPTGLSQNLTSGAFQNQYEIFVSSCKNMQRNPLSGRYLCNCRGNSVPFPAIEYSELLLKRQSMGQGARLSPCILLIYGAPGEITRVSLKGNALTGAPLFIHPLYQLCGVVRFLECVGGGMQCNCDHDTGKNNPDKCDHDGEEL